MAEVCYRTVILDTYTNTIIFTVLIANVCNRQLRRTLLALPEGVAEASQLLLGDAHVLTKLLSYEKYCRLAKL
jgi:hypothetical protein